MGANKYHKNLKKRGFTSHLHSWWFGVLLLLIVVAVLGIRQKSVDNLQQTNGLQRTVSDNDSSNHGVNYGVALGDGLYNADNKERARVLSKIKNAGFTEVRLGLNWEDVEGKQGTYNWIHLDKLMPAVKKSGLKMILLANSTPKWARVDVCNTSASCPPKNVQNYADYMAAAAERYRGYDIMAWEIWNEQNGNNFWKPQPDPEAYAELLKASYRSLKKVDPKTPVIIGGLSGDSVDLIGPNLIDPRTYLSKLYSAGAHGYFDGIAYHPYVGAASIDKKGEYNGWAKMSDRTNNIRGIMQAYGDADKDIWITEFGIPTGGQGPVISDPSNPPLKPDHVTPDAQAKIVQKAVASLNKSPWIRDFNWYTFQDGETAATNGGAAYGLWDYSGQEKPVLKVLQQGMKVNSQSD